MEWELLIALFSATLYLVFNELEDESVRNNWKTNQWFLNSKESWRNKWRLDDFGELIPYEGSKWKYFGFVPKYKEKFLYSSTLFVFVTDGEHLFQFFKNRFITIIGFAACWQMFVAIQLGLWIGSAIKEKIKSIQ